MLMPAFKALRRLPSALHRLWRDESGVAAVEFSLILPFLILVAYGTIETSRLILINQKAEKVAYTLSDIVAQNNSIGRSALDSLVLAAAHQVMDPYPFAAGASVIITAVSRATGSNESRVRWQYFSEQTILNPSQIGRNGGLATLPSGFVLDQGETVIIAEVFYPFEPLIDSSLAEFTLYKTAYFKPRLGALDTLGA